MDAGMCGMDNSLLRGMSDGDRYAARIAALQASGAGNGMIESMAMRQAFGPMEMQLQPPPSPLQQWILINSGNADNALPVGSCVKICHLTQAELARYNGLVGTIVSKHDVTNDDGTSDVLFDIRCPILPNIVDSPLMRKDKEHYAVKDSDGAKAEIPKNRRQVAPMYGLSMFEAEKDDDPRLPPFVFLTRLPSEKFEQFGEQQPQSTGSQFNVPKLKNPPIWGPPVWGGMPITMSTANAPVMTSPMVTNQMRGAPVFGGGTVPCAAPAYNPAYGVGMAASGVPAAMPGAFPTGKSMYY